MTACGACFTSEELVVSAKRKTKKIRKYGPFQKLVETTRLALQRAPLGDGEARKSRNARACIVTACGACFTSEELVVSAKRKTKRSVKTDLLQNGGDNKTRTCDLYDVNVAL